MNRFSGSYPGGPSRRRDDIPPSREARDALTPAEELTRAREARGLDERRRARSRRVALGFVVILALSAVGGVVTGLASHRSAADLAREAETRVQVDKGLDLEGERRKILKELWKMEALERAPSLTTGGR